MENEIWKDIKGYEGSYQVSNFGNVRSLDRYVDNRALLSGKQFIKGRILKQSDNGNGYLFVSLRKNKKYKLITVHRLVAETFIPNPENKKTVNHLDGIKSNNNVKNLEWATMSEQNIHAISIGLRKGWTDEARKRVSIASKEREGKKIRCITTGEIFGSMSDAERKYGLGRSTVSRSIYEKRETSGYSFEFLDENDAIRPISKKIDGRTIRREVRCINNGKIYNSLASASRDCGISSKSIYNSIKYKKSICGLMFEDI